MYQLSEAGSDVYFDVKFHKLSQSHIRGVREPVFIVPLTTQIILPSIDIPQRLQERLWICSHYSNLWNAVTVIVCIISGCHDTYLYVHLDRIAFSDSAFSFICGCYNTQCKSVCTKWNNLYVLYRMTNIISCNYFAISQFNMI